MTGGVDLQLGGLEALGERSGLAPRLRCAARLALGTADGPLEGELSLTFLEASDMEALNRRWLGRDGITDVIAFDLGGGPDPATPSDRAAPSERGPLQLELKRASGGDRAPARRLVGDVYVCPEAARRAAAEPGGPDMDQELVRLVVHGTLHVLGHDHPEGEGRWESPMYRMQESLVERAMAGDVPC